MRRSIFIPVLLILLILITQAASLPTAEEWRVNAPGKFQTLTKAEVDSFITPLIQYDLYAGIVVILVDVNGSAIYSYGVSDKKTNKTINNKTTFDIGSVSKTFTGLLMADAHIRGRYNLSTPVITYLPTGYTLPSVQGRDITGLDLATHTSGLPTVPDSFSDTCPDSSYADQVEESFRNYATLTGEEVYTWIRSQPSSGTKVFSYQYSNMGSAIAGDVVSRAQGISYDKLLKNRVLIPLGLNNTGTFWTKTALNNRTKGYRAYEYPRDEAEIVKFNEFWTSSGGLHSNADDMAVFLAAETGLLDTPLRDALLLSQKPYRLRTSGPPKIEEGLFLEILSNRDDTTIFLKAGETNAHQADIGFNVKDKVGVVILANTAYIGGMHVEDQVKALLEKMHNKI